jgi:hypothetical protein
MAVGAVGFEILSAFRLTQNRYLLAKYGHIAEDGFSQGRNVRRQVGSNLRLDPRDS